MGSCAKTNNLWQDRGMDSLGKTDTVLWQKIMMIQRLISRLRHSPCKLAVVQVCVEAVFFQQFPVGSLLNNATFVHDQN